MIIFKISEQQLEKFQALCKFNSIYQFLEIQENSIKFTGFTVLEMPTLVQSVSFHMRDRAQLRAELDTRFKGVRGRLEERVAYYDLFEPSEFVKLYPNEHGIIHLYVTAEYEEDELHRGKEHDIPYVTIQNIGYTEEFQSYCRGELYRFLTDNEFDLIYSLISLNMNLPDQDQIKKTLSRWDTTGIKIINDKGLKHLIIKGEDGEAVSAEKLVTQNLGK